MWWLLKGLCDRCPTLWRIQLQRMNKTAERQIKVKLKSEICLKLESITTEDENNEILKLIKVVNLGF